MANKWIKSDISGIRYREHPTRKHGVRRDKYFNIRFQVGGSAVDQGVGWASEGMTLQKAALLMMDLKEELRLGKGSGKLADRQKAQREAEESAQAATLEQERLTVSYETFYREQYEPSLAHKKENTARGERILQRLWVLPVIGKRPIREVNALDIERVKQRLIKAGRAPRTVEYTLAVIRMVINAAIQRRYFVGQNPVAGVKKMKFDNRRTRFLSHDEAKELLIEISKRSTTIHDMALLALHTGLRLGEIYALCWSDVDLTHSVLTVRDTKSGKTRHVPMTERVREMFQCITEDACTGMLVFPSRKGELRKGPISNSFDKAVDALGFNQGVTDRRQKVTFHVLRHTHASWLAMEGVELYTIGQILGHASLEMTARYSHLSPSKLRSAVDILEAALKSQAKVIPFKDVQHG